MQRDVGAGTEGELVLEEGAFDGGGRLRIAEDEELVGVFDGDFAAGLGAEEGADDGAFAVSEGVAGDVVGDGEEGEGVEGDLQPGGGGVVGESTMRSRHDGRWWGSYGEAGELEVGCEADVVG